MRPPWATPDNLYRANIKEAINDYCPSCAGHGRLTSSTAVWGLEGEYLRSTKVRVCQECDGLGVNTRSVNAP